MAGKRAVTTRFHSGYSAEIKHACYWIACPWERLLHTQEVAWSATALQENSPWQNYSGSGDLVWEMTAVYFTWAYCTLWVLRMVWPVQTWQAGVLPEESSWGVSHCHGFYISPLLLPYTLIILRKIRCRSQTRSVLVIPIWAKSLEKPLQAAVIGSGSASCSWCKETPR